MSYLRAWGRLRHDAPFLLVLFCYRFPYKKGAGVCPVYW